MSLPETPPPLPLLRNNPGDLPRLPPLLTPKGHEERNQVSVNSANKLFDLKTEVLTLPNLEAGGGSPPNVLTVEKPNSETITTAKSKALA